RIRPEGSDEKVDLQKRARWIAQLGDVSTGEPVVANGLVWVGTNNGNPRDANQTKDASVLMCFRESDGKFLYQYVSPRLAPAPGQVYWRRVDWPETSLASAPLVEGDRLWFCTNRCEVVCLDISQLLNGNGLPKVVWKYDMIEELGVQPRATMIGSHASHSSVAGYRDFIYVNTTNGRNIDGAVDGVGAPEAPSLICLRKDDGKLQWQDNSPGTDIIYVQHGSPTLIEVERRAQVVMGQGDGWVRSFDALTGTMIWKFDINPKGVKKHPFYNGNASHFVATPVFHRNRLFIVGGRERELGAVDGTLFCLDPKQMGDISEELLGEDGAALENPNSGVIWKYVGHGEKRDEKMHSALSNVAVHNGLVIAPDDDGLVHCLDEQTGEWLWAYDCFSIVVGAPLIVGDRVYVTDEDGDLAVLKLSRELQLLEELSLRNTTESSPTFANGTLYVSTRRSLMAIDGR
ncbi:MAG: PQQ-binding-like beta-propeller repeat protein, partial [Planctomycetaceae bacterium]|nr:PQQ-binding-like beta-propeller repeat protein [Planctomycetaceae bacterium]